MFLHSLFQLTLDVLGIVNYEVSIPHNRKVHWKVTDVIPFIEILPKKTQQGTESISQPYTKIADINQEANERPVEDITLFSLISSAPTWIFFCQLWPCQKQDRLVRHEIFPITREQQQQQHNFVYFFPQLFFCSSARQNALWGKVRTGYQSNASKLFSTLIFPLPT